MAASESDHLVEHQFRTEYGKLVAMLTSYVGPAHLDFAEDMVQETLIAALNTWSTNGPPENPTAWLFQVAKRKAINEINRRNRKQNQQLQSIPLQIDFANSAEVLLDHEIEDHLLRMIFTCCHPSISQEAQIALTLKTLCGFGVKEVAKALLTSESNINKRLYRAKVTIRNSTIPFVIPHSADLSDRLTSVCLTLYLLFNEGYNSSDQDIFIRKELCLEAVRLTSLLTKHFPEQKVLYALLSLMCLHAARFDARLDDQGAIILFEDQNRNLWNDALLKKGIGYLQKAMPDDVLSSYHIEANIAAEHCLASSFDTTNWDRILYLYRLLQKLKPSPITLLNLAIIESRVRGIPASLKLLAQISKEPALKNYYLLPATQGTFSMKLGDWDQAITYFETALSQSPPPVASKFIVEQISICRSRD